MKIFLSLTLLISSLVAAAYFFVEAVDQSEYIYDVNRGEAFDFKTHFQENSRYMSAISKRGDIKKVQDFKNNIAELEYQLMVLQERDIDTKILLKNIDTYKATLFKISDAIETDTPLINEEYLQLKNSLAFFNKKLSSIGLQELTTAWMELSKLKQDYMRSPNQNLENTFGEKWVYMNVLITELYLDEEMEAPLIEYLEVYKAYFDAMSAAYHKTDIKRVAAMRDLSYDIKLQIDMLPLPY